MTRGNGQDEQGRNTVLFVSLAAGLGGSARSLASLLEELDGVVERVVATPTPSMFADLIEDGGLAEEVVPLDPAGGYRISTIVTLLRWVSRNRRRLAAFHLNGTSALHVTAVAVLTTKAPAVVWLHDPAIGKRNSRLLRVWDRLARRLTWASVSEAAKTGTDRFAIRRPVVVVPNPIDAQAGTVEDLRKPDVVTIGYLGGFNERKGFSLLPEVMARIGQDLEYRWVTIVNRRPPSPAEANTLHLMNTAPGVEHVILKTTSDIDSVYARCDIVFQPSLQESFGRVAAEAMARGIPVVATDLPAIREVLVGDGKPAGLLFPPGDLLAAGRALRRLVLDAGLREDLGRAGISRSRSFAPGVIAETMRALYSAD